MREKTRTLMAVSKRLRFEILRRDGHTCRYCGRSAPEVQLVIDHVQAVALGGTDSPVNLVTSCSDCNSGKTSIAPDSPLVANVADDALKWARAIEAVAFSRAQERRALNELVAVFDREWTRWSDPDDRPIPRPQSWPDDVERFYAAGLSIETLVYLAGYTMRRDKVLNDQKWRYFAGCCWTTIDSIQEEARTTIARGEAIQNQWRTDGTH